MFCREEMAPRPKDQASSEPLFIQEPPVSKQEKKDEHTIVNNRAPRLCIRMGGEGMNKGQKNA